VVVVRKPADEAGRSGVCAGLSARVRLLLSLALITSLAGVIAACGGDGQRLGERVIPLGQPVPKGGGVYMLGKPYEVGGIWYTPREEPGYNRVGRASWYGELFHGRRTANGEIYDMDRLSAASPTLPLPVYAQVTNLSNGRTIVVRVNDRGPYANDRILDLSRRSAEVLGFRGSGTALVRVKYLGRAPLSGDDRYEQKFLASQGWMQVAAKAARKGKVPATNVATLPLENPENLKAPAQSAAAAPAPQMPMRPTTQPAPAPLQQDAAASYGWTMVAPPKQAEAFPFDAPLYWQASPRAGEQPEVAATGSLPDPAKQAPQRPGFLIQAGSFTARENADKARAALSAIAPVELAEIEAGGDTYFRVRVGPFPDRSGAQAALSKITAAGYQGAKIIARN
jgi:rare lipoprotein A